MDRTDPIRPSKDIYETKRTSFLETEEKLWVFAGMTVASVSTILLNNFLRRRQTVSNGISGLSELARKINQERVNCKVLEKLHVKERIEVPVERNGHKLNFTYIYVDNLKKKEKVGSKKEDPFMPPFEPGVCITDLSDVHRLIFNKFMVVDNHVLVITKKFHEQTEPLNNLDFAEAFKVLSALEGFCIYNSGSESGASQKHKHIQIIPYDKDLGYDVINHINKEIQHQTKPFQTGVFDFAHLIVPLPKFDLNGDFNEIGHQLEDIYKDIRKSLNIDDTKAKSYNMILTKDWMMLLLRSQEKICETMSMNALCFVGTFLAKDEKEKQDVQAKNPLEWLDTLTVKREK